MIITPLLQNTHGSASPYRAGAAENYPGPVVDVLGGHGRSRFWIPLYDWLTIFGRQTNIENPDRPLGNRVAKMKDVVQH